jgi:hypothetical protein
MLQPLYSQGKDRHLAHPLSKGLGGPHNQSGDFVEDKNLLPLTENKLHDSSLIQPVA